MSAENRSQVQKDRNPRLGIVMASRIRGERKRLGFTQQEAAEALGISRGSYAQLETGTSEPRISTLIALKQELGMDPRALVAEFYIEDLPGEPG